VARGQDYSAFPAPPVYEGCASGDPTGESDLDLSAIAVEEAVEEEVELEGADA
jgi:hypothetical protein